MSGLQAPGAPAPGSAGAPPSAPGPGWGWKAVRAAEAQLARRDNAEGRRLLNEARAKLTAVPVTEAQANDPAIAGAFRATRPDRPAAGRQAQFEEEWDRHAVAAYAEAKRLAEQAQRAR